MYVSAAGGCSMVSARLALALAAAALLAISCGDNDNDVSRDPCDPELHRAAFTQCRQAADQAACEAAGGSWARGGLLGDLHCFCPTGQSACPCTDASQCLGTCTGPVPSALDCPGVTTGTCQEVAPFFGCACVPLSEGGFTGLCAD
jgi:hypothetical protein